MSREVLLAVDGGGSKTHAVAFTLDGTVLAFVRSGTTSPHHLGLDGAKQALAALLQAAFARADLDPATRPRHATFAMHGLDLPREEDRFAVMCAGLADDLWVGNDIFAVLRGGTDHGWGVAVGAGSGMNAVGVHPDGTVARFLALGGISGDWGGGWDLGQAAIGAACRALDGRGPDTALVDAVPCHYGRPDAFEVAAAFTSGDLESPRIAEAARIVLDLADDDPVAGVLVDRLVQEIAAMAAAAARRAGLNAPPVILSGGLIQSGCPRLITGSTAAIWQAAGSVAMVAAAPPIAGAALLAADRATMSAAARTRLTAAIVSLAAAETQQRAS